VSLFPAHPVRLEHEYNRTRALGYFHDDPDFRQTVREIWNALDSTPAEESKRERWRKIVGVMIDAAQLAWQMSEDDVKCGYDLGGEGG